MKGSADKPGPPCETMLGAISLAEVAPVLLPTYVLLRRGQQQGAVAAAFLGLLQETYQVKIPLSAENGQGNP